MVIPPCRWLLPIGHFLVDTVILLLLIAHARPLIQLISSGNLPAAVVSLQIRPRACIPTRSHLWDPEWFLIHEAVALAIWYIVGLGIDSGRFRLRREMLAYLAARAACTALLPFIDIARPAASLELLVWCALAIWAAGWCILRVVQPLRQRRKATLL